MTRFDSTATGGQADTLSRLALNKAYLNLPTCLRSNGSLPRTGLHFAVADMLSRVSKCGSEGID